MAKMTIECADPNDFKKVMDAAEKAAGSCTITYAKQHLEMINAGTSKSIRESSKIISKDSDETPKAVEHKIHRGLKEVPHDGAKKSEQTKDTEMIKKTESENKNDGVNLLINRPIDTQKNFEERNEKSVLFYNIHQKLVKIGKSSSQAQSARIISESEDIGNTEESLRALISKGKKIHNLNIQRKEAIYDQEYFLQHKNMIDNGISKSLKESAKIISEKSDFSQQIMQAKIRRGEILSMPNENNGDKSNSPLVTIKSALMRLIKINKYLMDRLEFPFKKKVPNEYINTIKDEINLLNIILTQIEGENNEKD